MDGWEVVPGRRQTNTDGGGDGHPPGGAGMDANSHAAKPSPHSQSQQANTPRRAPQAGGRGQPDGRCAEEEGAPRLTDGVSAGVRGIGRVVCRMLLCLVRQIEPRRFRWLTVIPLQPRRSSSRVVRTPTSLAPGPPCLNAPP